MNTVEVLKNRWLVGFICKCTNLSDIVNKIRVANAQAGVFFCTVKKVSGEVTVDLRFG